MNLRHLRAHVLLGALLLLLAGCSTSPPDAVEATDAVSGTVLVLSSWHPGNGFLIDKENGLILSSNNVVGERDEIDILFPAVDNGKVLTKKSTFISKGTKLEAKVVARDAGRDVAVLQLKKPAPDSANELKLAAADPAKDAAVQFLGASVKSSLTWAAATANVQAVAPKEFLLDGKKKVHARTIELNAEGALAKEVNGGPVLNEKNEVIGIIAAEPAQTGQLLCLDIAEARPALAHVFGKMATQALEKKNYDKALAYSDRALAYHKGDPLLWNERGAAYSMKDQYPKAVADYSEAIKLNPQFVRALINRASAYLHLGKYREAVDDCDKAVDVNPKISHAYAIRRHAHLKLNQKEKADLDARLLHALDGGGDWKVTGSSGSKPPGQ